MKPSYVWLMPEWTVKKQTKLAHSTASTSNSQGKMADGVRKKERLCLVNASLSYYYDKTPAAAPPWEKNTSFLGVCFFLPLGERGGGESRPEYKYCMCVLLKFWCLLLRLRGLNPQMGTIVLLLIVLTPLAAFEEAALRPRTRKYGVERNRESQETYEKQRKHTYSTKAEGTDQNEIRIKTIQQSRRWSFFSNQNWRLNPSKGILNLLNFLNVSVSHYSDNNNTFQSMQTSRVSSRMPAKMAMRMIHHGIQYCSTRPGSG